MKMFEGYGCAIISCEEIFHMLRKYASMSDKAPLDEV